MRQSVPSFISYSHKNAASANRLADALDPLLKTSARYEFSAWRDHAILPGEFWRQEIEAALAKAKFGLLLLSPEFLASDFIDDHELSQLLAKPIVVPVSLSAIPLDGSIDLKRLAERQIFRDSKGRPFDKCRTPADRADFARELFEQIDRLLRKYL